MSGTLTISGTFSSGFVSPTLALPQILSGSLTAREQVVDLASGANTITVPTGAVAMIMALPSGNTVAVTLKGISGDTGILLHTTYPLVLPLGSVSTLVLTAAGAVTATIVWM